MSASVSLIPGARSKAFPLTSTSSYSPRIELPLVPDNLKDQRLNLASDDFQRNYYNNIGIEDDRDMTPAFLARCVSTGYASSENRSVPPPPLHLLQRPRHPPPHPKNLGVP